MPTTTNAGGGEVVKKKKNKVRIEGMSEKRRAGCVCVVWRGYYLLPDVRVMISSSESKFSEE